MSASMNKSFESNKNESPDVELKGQTQGPIQTSEEKSKMDNVNITLKFEPGIEPKTSFILQKSGSIYSDKDSINLGESKSTPGDVDTSRNAGNKSETNSSISQPGRKKEAAPANKGLVINKGMILPPTKKPLLIVKPGIKLPGSSNKSIDDELDLAAILGNPLAKK